MLEYLKSFRTKVTRSLLFPPLVVLVAVFVITIWQWQTGRINVQHSYEKSVNSRTSAVDRMIQERFTSYTNVLQGPVGLFQTTETISRERWQAFTQATGAVERYPGVQAIGFTQLVSSDQLSALTDSMRAQGIADFIVHPTDTNQTTHSIVEYLYPETSNNTSAIGYDMYSEPTRRMALEDVRDTGQPQLTRRIKLVQNNPTPNPYGFLLVVPLYRPGSSTATLADRRANIQGYVYGSFRASNFFQQVVDKTSNEQHYSLAVYDTTVDKKNLFYQTPNTDAITQQKHIETITKPLKVLGVTWQLVYTFDRDQVLSHSEQNTPTYILVVGMATGFLIFLALFAVLRGRARELQLQKDQELEMAKDELLSLASHQMRTPATGVKQYLGMVIQGFTGKLPVAQMAMLEKAYSSNERQLHVINQVLHLAKLESGRVVLAKHDTNLNVLIRDIVEEQRREAESHSHKLRVSLPKTPIKLQVDAHMLRMAIENIVSNAIKYTLKAGRINITLSKKGRNVFISVKDTGIGIDPANYEQMFKQFSRLYDERAVQISGTGVGLYLAEQLVKLHGGSVEVTSQLGKGSTFTIQLPVVKKL